MAIEKFIGIDPGKKGAVAAISIEDKERHKLDVYPLPESIKEKVQLLTNIITGTTRNFCVVEKVHASPQMGVVSAFTFGKGFGHLEGMLTVMMSHRDYEFVNPQVWQTGLDCLTGGDKKISVRRVGELFPAYAKVKKDYADAILISYYCYRLYGQR